MSTTTRYASFATPLGEMFAVSIDDRIVRLDFSDAKYARPIEPTWQEAPRDRVLAACARQLAEYFAGQRTAFDLPLAATGTPFQERIWQEIARVPFGHTITYSELARRAGEGSSRSAGTATGRNPIAVAIPCHRIIGKSGHLTGYAGGIARKTHLLTLEGVLLQ